MSLPVVLRDEAQAEFDEAFDWYDAQRSNLRVTWALNRCFTKPGAPSGIPELTARWCPRPVNCSVPWTCW
jgi:hypothetical protein